MPIIKVNELDDYLDKHLDAGDWFTVDQASINHFAEVTCDHQFIHIDEEKAKQTPFGGTIAHGFLTLSLLTHLVGDAGITPEGSKVMVNYGFDKVRFLMPVAAGKRVRANCKLLEAAEKKPGRHLLKTEVSIELEGEETPALIAEWLVMYFV